MAGELKCKRQRDSKLALAQKMSFDHIPGRAGEFRSKEVKTTLKELYVFNVSKIRKLVPSRIDPISSASHSSKLNLFSGRPILVKKIDFDAEK